MELLAVIVILAIILVIVVPKVMSVIEDSKRETLESTSKMIASQAEKAKVQNTVLSKDRNIKCEDVDNGYGINQWGLSTYTDGRTYLGADLMQLLNGFYIEKNNNCKYCTLSEQAICSETCTIDSLKSAKMKVLTSTAKGIIDGALWDTYAAVSPSSGGTDSSWSPTVYL